MTRTIALLLFLLPVVGAAWAYLGTALALLAPVAAWRKERPLAVGTLVAIAVIVAVHAVVVVMAAVVAVLAAVAVMAVTAVTAVTRAVQAATAICRTS